MLNDEKTVQEQKVFDYYKEIEAENFLLKKQLQKERKEVRRLKHLVRVWKRRADEKPKNKRKKEWYD
jgi:hypothetical protein